MSMNPTPRRHTQQGLATLAITMLLLFAMSLAALFVNRSLIFEQRASANYLRSTKAFEMAEAGLDWTTAMLNDPRGIDAHCRPIESSPSFRTKFVPLNEELALQIVPSSHPACRLHNDTLTCSCPEPGTNPDPGGSNEDVGSFTISFDTVPSDPNSVQIISTGCTNTASDCILGSQTSPAEAIARSKVILKLRPLLRVLPGAALTVGGSVTLSGSTTLQNTDRLTAGVLVEAGGSVVADDSARLATLPGSPAADFLIDNESSLDKLHGASDDGEGFFNAFFGMSTDHYRGSAAVRTITGATAGERGSALLAAYQQGYDAFYADGDLEFEAAGIGSATRPLLIVSTQGIRCTHACAVSGLIYSDTAVQDHDAAAGVQVRGAVMTRGEHRQSTGDGVSYEPATLSRLRQRAAVFARVPGSWRDF